MAAPLRTIVRGGMSVSISDSYLRALTITVFLDNRDAFLAALNIPNADTLQILLLNTNREIVWQGAGEFTPAQGNAIRAEIM